MVVILACDGFGEILTSDPVSDLRHFQKPGGDGR